MFVKSVLVPILIVLALASVSIVGGQTLNVIVTRFEDSICTGQFVSHRLPHTTIARRVPIQTFESNGAGVAVNDLDQNGFVDIVLANLNNTATLLLNQGNLEFQKVHLNTKSPTRAVSIVDVDGNGELDIIFTTQTGSPIVWWNEGQLNDVVEDALVFGALPGVRQQAYSMAWADADYDGDLDLVTASYDAELEMLLRDTFLFGRRAGVFYYENDAGVFVPLRLAERAQGLVTYLYDLDMDGHWELMVGNDFGLADQFWSYQNDAWQIIEPFKTITHSTMSASAADINNDGDYELFATDMKPYSEDNDVLAIWQSIHDAVGLLSADDPQIMENILYTRNLTGYENRSHEAGIDATGWSWSAQFGDLDNDGFQDLYVTNGMIAANLFEYLPDNTLVEENQVFHNQSGEYFVAQPNWGLNSTDSGRGMVMADMDNDGDLDIVVNNLLSPAMLFENQLCGRSIQLDLRLPNSQNTHAIGSRIMLHTNVGTYNRHIQATSGYISGNTTRIHFGVPESASIQFLEIIWPDGSHSRVDLPNNQFNTYLVVIRA